MRGLRRVRGLLRPDGPEPPRELIELSDEDRRYLTSLYDDSVPLPLARTVPGSPESRDPARPATPARIIVYRRPLLARADNEGELSDLVFDVEVHNHGGALPMRAAGRVGVPPGFDQAHERIAGAGKRRRRVGGVTAVVMVAFPLGDRRIEV